MRGTCNKKAKIIIDFSLFDLYLMCILKDKNKYFFFFNINEKGEKLNSNLG